MTRSPSSPLAVRSSVVAAQARRALDARLADRRNGLVVGHDVAVRPNDHVPVAESHVGEAGKIEQPRANLIAEAIGELGHPKAERGCLVDGVHSAVYPTGAGGNSSNAAERNAANAVTSAGS
jgi:hypothetical protein